MYSRQSSWVAAMCLVAMAVLPHLASAQNVAFNKTVWVSSVLPPYDGPFAVDEIFSPVSRWISDTSINHFLVVDLEDPYVAHLLIVTLFFVLSLL